MDETRCDDGKLQVQAVISFKVNQNYYRLNGFKCI